MPTVACKLMREVITPDYPTSIEMGRFLLAETSCLNISYTRCMLLADYIVAPLPAEEPPS
jgi:hypothetical protein